MAPTEILAEQHFANIARLPAGIAVPRGAADRFDVFRRAP
jgi:RecG-like helicase